MIKKNKKDIIVGRLSPGIMITDFITNALGNKEKIELPEKTKKVYNILGDYPDVVAKFLVNRILNNKKSRTLIFSGLALCVVVIAFIILGNNKIEEYIYGKKVSNFFNNTSNVIISNIIIRYCGLCAKLKNLSKSVEKLVLIRLLIS